MNARYSAQIPRVPFASSISSDADVIDRRSLDWAAEHGLLASADQLEKIKAERLGWLTARTYPYARSETMQVIADWHIWLFAFDDGYCDESTFGGRHVEMTQMAARLMRVVDLPEDEVLPGSGRCANGLRDVRLRLAQRASPKQIQRWCAAVHDYLFGVVWESANRSSGAIPALREYVHLRRYAGAITACLCLIDIANGEPVVAEDWENPGLGRLTLLAADLIGWDNDIVSYEKELSDHGAMHNLITVLSHENDCSTADAFDLAMGMHSDAVGEFCRLEAELRPLLGSEAGTYISGLKSWVRGFIDYAATTDGRYAGHQSRAPTPKMTPW